MDRPMVHFYRVKDFQLVTLRQIGQELMTLLVKTRADDVLYIAGELVESPLVLPSRLVVSEHNAGAPDLSQELQGASRRSVNRSLTRSLTRPFTSVVSNAPECVLLLLDERTFEHPSVAIEVHAVLDAAQRLVLVHDVRVPFGEIIERTPKSLRERRLYDELAVMLLPGEHRQVSLRYIAAKMVRNRSVLEGAATAASNVGAEIGARGKTFRAAALRALPRFARRRSRRAPIE